MAAHQTYAHQPAPHAYGAADIEEEDKLWENDGAVGEYLQQRTPRQPQRLKMFSVICIIINRMIGTYCFLIKEVYSVDL